MPQSPLGEGSCTSRPAPREQGRPSSFAEVQLPSREPGEGQLFSGHGCLIVIASTMPSQEWFHHVEAPWRLVAGAWLLWPMANNAVVALTESQKEGLP